MKDSDFVMCRYTHPNRGKHKVVGPATKINYGYRAGGDVFLVNKQDIQSTHLFQELAPLPPPVIHPAAPPPPPPVAPPKPVEPLPAVVTEEESKAEEEAFWGLPADGPVGPLDLQALPGVTPGVAKAMIAAGLNSAEAIRAAGEEGLKTVKGIGPARAKALLKFLEKE